MFGKCSNLVPSQRWAADRRCTDRPASFPRGARAIVRTEHQAHAFRRHEGNCSAKWPRQSMCSRFSRAWSARRLL
ncbi:MAG: DUF3648 domain-containing protein, partial [Mesorhizobium sp.]